ncbi:DNA internalization-related competence protein ComEC/Rec2 [Paucidesulfovibrio longus]|uniref:DNA internalization-related competence protein ComEC/Rec2 n=1 Tax=Paucidesulfovibrio longus TaxID=889 RepID=UPI0003B3DDA7|nr:DNA internalization-related competence protein ComEC/Rec2 [Paucidesulfovibrio longus]
MSLKRGNSGPPAHADAAPDFHSASPLPLLAWQVLVLGFASGVGIARWPLPGAVCLAAVVLLDARSRRPVAFWGMLLALAFGGWLYAASLLPAAPEPTPGWLDERVPYRVSGMVESVEGKPGRRWQVVLADVECRADGETHRLPENVVWYWHDPVLRPVPGQHVELRSSLMQVSSFKNPGAWDYALYWRMQGVGYSAYCSGGKDVAFQPPQGGLSANLRASLLGSILNGAPEGQGRALLLALLTGDRFELDPATVDVLRRAGLAHTLALSGLHLGFVVVVGWALAWLVGRIRPRIFLVLPRPKLAVLFAAPAVLAYVWLGQATPSLVRAALMFGFWGLLLLRGRGRVLLDGLFLALACILLFSPLSLFDIRLQLSVTAVAGIALFYPLLRVRMDRSGPFRRLAGGALDLLAVSLCANLALLPITARLFGTLVPNLLPNLFWIPMLGFVVMPLGGAGMLLGACPGVRGLGEALVSLAAWLLQWMLDLVTRADAGGLLPSWLLLRPLWPELIGAGLLLVCTIMYFRRPRELPWSVVFSGLVLLAAPQLHTLWIDSRDEVRLEVLDVGQGQSLLISAPGGRRSLIDGGGLRSRTLETGRDVVAPYLTLGRPPRLELMVLSHPHMDHYKGLLYLLRHFEVGAFAHNGRWPSGHYGQELRGLLENAGLKPVEVVSGSVFDLGGGGRLEALMPPPGADPPSTNDGSIVFLLRRNGRNLAVLPGDAEEWSLMRVTALERDLRSDVLVLPHHGSRTGLVPAFFARISPQAVFSSCGRFGTTKLPSPQVLELPELRGAAAYDTAEHGLLRAVWASDGFPLRVGPARPE